MNTNNNGVLGRWFLGAALAVAAAVGPTLPANANDAGAYVANAVECAIWAVTDPDKHDKLCIDKPLSGPYASIHSTGSGTAQVY